MREIIQCFDPARQSGATAGRSHKFINLCFAIPRSHRLVFGILGLHLDEMSYTPV